MSADNFVAILSSKVYPEATEYQEFRVAYGHALGNLYKNDMYMEKYFKNSNVFDTYDAALEHARRLEREHGPTEFGIVLVKHPRERTWDEICTGKRYRKEGNLTTKKPKSGGELT